MDGIHEQTEGIPDHVGNPLARLAYARARLDSAEKEYQAALREYQSRPCEHETDHSVAVAHDRVMEAREAYEGTLYICQRMIAIKVSRLPGLAADAEGYDMKPDPLTARIPAEMVAALRQYREWAGQPSFRKMADRIGHGVAASTLCTALRHDHMPRLEIVMAVIIGCGGNEEDQRTFATAWRQIRAKHLVANAIHRDLV